MKNTYKALFGAMMGAGVLSAPACTDLDEHIYDTIASEKHEFTDAELAQTIAPVYSQLRTVYWGWFGLSDITEMGSDVWTVPSRIGIGWGEPYVSVHKHNFHVDGDFFAVNWDFNYAGVNACNRALANDVVSGNEATNAEIRAFRVLYYYNLFSLFRNIPLDITYNHEAGWLPSQSDPKETYEWMVNEMKDVADVCPASAELGKMNKYAAHMILAKLYLNHNAWFNDDSDLSYYEKAIDELDKVMDGPFSLASSYSANFVEDISKSPEIIFGIPLENKYAGGNYMANLWIHNAGRTRWNFEGWATGGGIVFPQFLDIYEDGDKRMDLCWTGGQQYAEDGSPILVDGEPLVYTKELHSIDNPGCYPFESYRLIKYEILGGDFGTSYDDVPYYRLADAYLMKAECLLRLGKDEATAAELVSKVRSRCFDDESKSKVTAAYLKGGSKYKYGHRENRGKMGEADDWLITDEGGDDIEFGGLLDELAREFVCEAHRRDDLIRFKINGSNLNVWNGKSWFCKDATTDRHQDIYPIPKSALDGNIKLKQNPGY